MVPESPGSFGSSSNAHLGMLGSILAEGLSREPLLTGCMFVWGFTLTASGLGCHDVQHRD